MSGGCCPIQLFQQFRASQIPQGMVEAPRSVLLEGAALCLLLEARGAPSRELDGTPCTQGGGEEAGSVEERSLSGLLLPIQARWKSCQSPAAEMRVLPPLAGCLLGRGGGGDPLGRKNRSI